MREREREREYLPFWCGQNMNWMKKKIVNFKVNKMRIRRVKKRKKKDEWMEKL